MGREHDLGLALGGATSEQFHEQPEATGVDAVLDLLDGHDPGHVRLEERRRYGRKAQRTLGQHRRRPFSVPFLHHHHRFAKGPLQHAHIVYFARAQLLEPTQIGFLDLGIVADHADQRREVLSLFPHPRDLVCLRVLPQYRRQWVNALHVGQGLCHGFCYLRPGSPWRHQAEFVDRFSMIAARQLREHGTIRMESNSGIRPPFRIPFAIAIDTKVSAGRPIVPS